MGDELLACFIGFVFCVVFVVCPIVTAGFDGKYKEGQIDAINGKISYQLVTHEDKTQTWEKIDKK